MKKVLLFTIFIFQFHSIVYSQMINASFERITTKDGLSQSTVNYIIQDRKGFMWFATYDGLNKYDGYNFKVYKNIIDDSSSLINNSSRFLFEDSKGYIWVLNNANEGVGRFNPETEKFTRFYHNPEDSTTISNNEVFQIMQDNSGRTWLTTRNALNLFVESNAGNIAPTFKKFRFLSADNYASWIHEGRNGKLLLFADSVYYFDTALEKITNAHINMHHETGVVNSSCEDNKGNIWLGTYGSGIMKLIYNKTTQRYHKAELKNVNITPVNRNYVLIDDNETIWIASEFKGLFQYNEQDNQLINFTNDKLNPNSISDNSISSLYMDRSKVLWIGTTSQGICKYDLLKKQFEHYKAIPNEKNSLSGNVISSIHSVKSDELWVGMDLGGGITRLLFEDDLPPRFIHYMHDPQNENTIGHNRIFCLTQRKNGNVWAGSARGYVSKIIPETPGSANGPIIKRYRILLFTFSIYEDSQGTLWGGTWNGGLWKYNEKSDNFTFYKNDPDNPSSICDNVIWALGEDREGNLWIGGHDKGLSVLPASEKNKLNLEFINFHNEKGNAKSLSSNTINAFCQDHTGAMWIGTAGGLNKAVIKNGNLNSLEFVTYHTNDGLPSEGITGVLEEDFGNLWLSSNNGISKFNISEDSFTNYNESDGLQSNEFWHNAYFKDQNGKIYFGGNNGFNAFYPDSIKPNPFLPQVVFTDFTLFYKSVRVGEEINNDIVLSKSITETSEIILSHKNNIFSIEFAALHYNQPENNKYLYKMEGFNKEWVETNADFRSVSYTNLPAGHYTFKVKASNSDGLWNEEGASLRITITPPFWKTMWFRIISLIFIVLCVFGIIEYRIYGINKQKKRLEALVEERTQDLSTSNQELEVQKQRLQENTDALKRSNEELEQFAYVASHDLQEPLRMVSSYMSLLEKRNKDKLDSDSKEFIEYAVDGASRMQNLIQDLLIYSRITTKAKPFEKIDSEEIFKKVLMNLKVTIEQCSAKVTHNKLPVIMADISQLERLFQNLIGNGIKYRNEHTPEIHVSANKKGKEWIFQVRDNGIGINPKYYDRIFGIFQRLHTRNEYSGTGIGLAVCKKIVERHGGRIWVESDGEGKGSTFYFTIPDKEDS